MNDILIIIIIGILGLVFGSFFACMGYRIPNKMKLFNDRSICPNCKKQLKWYMNIPVVSYLYLKGKCAYCKKPISPIYPFIELATCLLFITNYIMFDFSYEFVISIIVTSMLMVTIVSDFMYFYISDRVLLLGSIFTIISMYIFKGFDYTFTHIISGVVLFIIMYLIKLFGNYLFKKESLGDGDIKLMGVIGIILGITNSFFVLFIGSVIGIIFSFIIAKKNKDGIIPFGPFLLIGSLLVLYYSEFIERFINLLLY